MASRLGMDHSYVQGSPNALVAMARFFDKHGSFLDHAKLDKLFFTGTSTPCYGSAILVQWRQESGKILWQFIEGGDPVDNLIKRLKDDNRRDLRVFEQDLTAANRGGRFYAMLYMLTRVYGARDFCKGIELKKFLLGGGNQLELHHIFPKGSTLYKSVTSGVRKLMQSPILPF